MTASDSRAAPPVAVVQEQLDAYNARDLARFVAVYADDIAIYRLPTLTPAIAGKAQLAQFYAEQRFNRAALHAELLNRIVVGNKVVDHERVHGVADTPLDVIAAYEVIDGRIAHAWFLSAS